MNIKYFNDIINGKLSKHALDFLENSKNNPQDYLHRMSYKTDAARSMQYQNNTRFDIALNAENILHQDFAESELFHLNSKRRSTRNFSKEQIPFTIFSNLLGKSYYIVDEQSNRFNIPSGGALYPVDIFVISLRIQHLKNGVYYYNPFKKCLNTHIDLDKESIDLFLEKAFFTNKRDDIDIASSAAIIVFAGFCGRSSIKYGDLGLKFALIEAGAILQSFYLTAAQLGIGICANGGFYDDYLKELLSLNNNTEQVLLTAIVGSHGSQ